MLDHVRVNRRHWDDQADDWVAAGERSWASPEPYWGIWGIPERELNLLPATLAGQTAIELGCGTAYVSAWMARRGAAVLAIDASSRQLRTARRLASEHRVDLKLVQGNAETVPCPDGSFDFAVSEYGAAIWCDPHLWIPEARRLLKPGGRLVFLGNSPLASICSPPGGSDCEPRFHRAYFDLRRLDWTSTAGGIEFNLPISEWLRLFRDTGFEVLDYLELRAPDSASETRFGIPADWARRWPAEHAWKLRRR
jgi:SAM-dependent methyltransferase